MLGAVRYQLETALAYVVPVAPPETMPPNVVGGTAHVIRGWTEANDLDGRSWTVIKGFFLKGSAKNIEMP